MIRFILNYGFEIHHTALYIATLIIFVLTSFIVYEYFSKKKINKPIIKAIIMLICLYIIYNHITVNAYGAFVYIGLLCSIILICSLISDCFSVKKSRKYITCKAIILLVYLLIIVFNMPFYFFIKALNTKEISPVKAEKYYLLAKNTAIIPSVKLYMCYELISFYGSYSYKGEDRGKKIIDICEKNIELSKDMLVYLIKYRICAAYFWKPDRAKLNNYCGSIESLLAVDYMRNKEYNEALEIINNDINKYDSKYPQRKIPCVSYGIRANIYKKMGNSYKYHEDYDKIMSSCASDKYSLERAKQYAEADDILDVFVFSGTKKDWENTY